MARFVLTTFGSYGDVFPYLAIGERLLQRGHTAVIAAPESYRRDVEDLGLEFAAVRPDVAFDDTETFLRLMDPRRGTERVVRELLLPSLRDAHADLQTACDGADLLVSHVLTYAAPIIGESTGLPWVSTVLSPMVFCSPSDPPALPPIPWFARLRPLGPGVIGFLLRRMMKFSWSWSEPIRALRTELGLNADADPMWEGQHSPHGVLALFSETFAARQPDWPAATTTCGFPFHDRDFGGDGDAEELAAFLADGPAPLVFSLGSSSVQAAGDFYASAARAAVQLGQRAVLVLGDRPAPPELPDTVLAIRSTPLQPLFDAASIVIHAGGIGSTGQALRAGRSQLVIPFAHDQFDNALRVERRGIGLRLDRRRLTTPRLSARLAQLLGDHGIEAKARAMAPAIRTEDGAGTACLVIEQVLAGTTRH